MKNQVIRITVFLLAFFVGLLVVPRPTELEMQTTTSPKLEPVEAANDDEKIETVEEAADDPFEGAFHIKLLETGEGFHGDEVEAKSGEKWFGLFRAENESTIELTTLSVKRVHDEIVDDKAGIRTGKTVEISGRRKPLFLVRNFDSIRQGAVQTLFHGMKIEEAVTYPSDQPIDEMVTRLDKKFEQSYEMGGEKYLLRVIKAKNKADERLLALVLETANKRQILHTMQTSYEGERGVKEWLGQVGTLYWVGDLDRDEKPDFYVDLFLHENVSYRVLFLSSGAEDGRLVKKVARFVTTGC